LYIFTISGQRIPLSARIICYFLLSCADIKCKLRKCSAQQWRMISSFPVDKVAAS